MSSKYKAGDVVMFRGFEIRRNSDDAAGRWMYRPAGGPITEGVSGSLEGAKKKIRAILAYYK